ncbi:MAG: class F420-dependent enzyme [Actinomycetia bacterium]|nr:class F420-dependent enzyme [Actinomycetes bacterium]
MDLEAARDFLRVHHRAVLATRRADGSPQMSPIVCALDEEGRVMISTREPALKVKNVRRDPAVSLCVLPDGFYGQWIQVDGTAEIVPLPEAMDLLVELYRSISGEHDNWDDYRAAMVRDRRCIVRITPTRAGPNRSG